MKYKSSVYIIFFILACSLMLTFAAGAEDITPPIVIDPPASVDSVEISSLPKKTVYFEGDELSLDGAKIKIIYSDGETETVSINPQWVSADLSKPGEIPVSVTYQGLSCSFNVTVNAVEVTSIKITSTPKRTEYFVGEPIDTEGLTVSAYYNNGDVKDVTSEIVLTGLDSTTAGQKEVSVSYGELTDSFTLTVAEPTISEMELISPPKLEYLDGEEFSPDGCSVLVKYNSGATETLTEGFTFSGFNSSVLGEQEITLYYGGLSLTFKITVSLSPYHTHTPLPTEHVVLPTCTECGIDRITCAVCHEVASEISVPPLGHSYGEFTVITYPTADAEGVQTHTCTVCRHSEEISIDRLSGTLTSGDFTLELLGEGCVFPYLAQLRAQDIIGVMTEKNVSDLNSQLSALMSGAELVHVVDVSVALPSDDIFTPECSVRLTYRTSGEERTLYTITDGKVTPVECGADALSITANTVGEFLIFTADAPDTASPATTQAPSTAAEGNASAATLIVAVIGVLIVLIVTVYVFVIKKFYY